MGTVIQLHSRAQRGATPGAYDWLESRARQAALKGRIAELFSTAATPTQALDNTEVLRLLNRIDQKLSQLVATESQ